MVASGSDSDSSGAIRVHPFPGESYTITEYKTWYRVFQAQMARKGLLRVLMTGVAEPKEDESEAERQRRNRLDNSSLYGYLLESMAPNAPDLSAEIQSAYIDEGHAAADGYEAIRRSGPGRGSTR